MLGGAGGDGRHVDLLGRRRFTFVNDFSGDVGLGEGGQPNRHDGG